MITKVSYRFPIGFTTLTPYPKTYLNTFQNPPKPPKHVPQTSPHIFQKYPPNLPNSSPKHLEIAEQQSLKRSCRFRPVEVRI